MYPLGTGLAPITPAEPRPLWHLARTHKQGGDAARGTTLLALEFPKCTVPPVLLEVTPALILTLTSLLTELAATIFSWKIKYKETHYATGKRPSPNSPSYPSP